MSSLPYDILNNIFFYLAYFILRVKYMIHIQNMCLLASYVIGKAKSRLLVKFWGSEKSYMQVLGSMGT